VTKTAAKTQGKPTIRLPAEGGKSKARRLADASLDPAATGMATALMFSKGTFGEQDAAEVYAAMQDKVRAVKGGSLAGPEATLTAQAVALDLIFTELVRRSALNMGEYIEASERYMRLALKAQAQCRSTIETLAALKNPPVVYARQANISAGHQQVNNHARGSPPSPAENSATPQNELLEAQNDQRVELGAKSSAECSNPSLEAVAAIHGPQDDSRQASLEPER
jgi:hypothetical protein